MSPTLAFRDLMAAYASKLKNMGAGAANQSNFFFGPALPDSDVLEQAIRSRAVYPALVVEYPDNEVNDNNKTGLVETLPFGVAIIANHSPREQAAVKDELIYEVCKPLLDQIIAKLQKDSDAKLLGEACRYKLQVLRTYNGSWVGPIANGAYGYRYTVDVRVFGGDFVYDAGKWNP